MHHDRDGGKVCKPAAGTLALLREGRFLYSDALEGTENTVRRRTDPRGGSTDYYDAPGIDGFSLGETIDT